MRLFIKVGLECRITMNQVGKQKKFSAGYKE